MKNYKYIICTNLQHNSKTYTIIPNELKDKQSLDWLFNYLNLNNFEWKSINLNLKYSLSNKKMGKYVQFYPYYLSEHSLIDEFIILNKNFFNVVKCFLINYSKNNKYLWPNNDFNVHNIEYESLYKEYLLKNII